MALINAYLYIMASRSGCIYVGVTNDLARRVSEHKSKLDPDSFTAHNNCTKLVYTELHETFEQAIRREKQLKNWRRDKKTALIAAVNPEWNDLSEKYSL